MRMSDTTGRRRAGVPGVPPRDSQGRVQGCGQQPPRCGRGLGQARLLPMIKVETLTKTYGGFTAVDDISFTARPGRVTGFLGPNGAGKSTTMRVMVGLTPPTSGSVTISGRGYRDLPTPGSTSACSSTPPPSTPAGPGGRSSPWPSARWGCPHSRVDQMLERVSLTEKEAGRRVRHYSLGHAPAARHRHRPDRRPVGADPRRARQRPRPGGHPLDARPAPRATPTAAAPCCCPRTCSTRSR